MVLVALFCDGCFPAKFITTPAVRGVVVNRQTGAPVTGAEVIISRARFDPWIMVDPATHQPLIVNDARLLSLKPPALSEVLKRARTPAVQPADDGSFSIPNHSQWGPYLVGMDPIPPAGTILIRREGYVDVMLPVFGTTVDFGAIPLDSTR
jgi:hypothetical protein